MISLILIQRFTLFLLILFYFSYRKLYTLSVTLKLTLKGKKELNNKLNYLSTFVQSYKPPTKNDTFLDCVVMIDRLPAVDSPRIFGMNENVVYAFKVKEGETLLEQLSSMQTRRNHVAVRLVCVCVTDVKIIQ